MKRLFIIVALFCLAAPAALAVPPVGKGKPESTESSSSTPSAAQLCKQQKKQMKADFVSVWAPGRNRGRAMKACLAGQVQAQSEDAKNAAKKCKAERQSMGVDAFNDKYGTNKNKRNAFGKCVSGYAKETAEDRHESTLNAAKMCKAERQAIGAEAFAGKYGSNKNKRNAFGKCVSKLSKEKGSSS